jgi:hypothetical protein
METMKKLVISVLNRSFNWFNDTKEITEILDVV